MKNYNYLIIYSLFILFSTTIGIQAHHNCFFSTEKALISDVDTFPKNYFRSPLGIPLVLAGTFGELRSNHFHSGIDIKTQGKSGLNIYGVADGWVSRIRSSPGGYGKALYITHPNGYTTVYGHLSEFSDTIGEYLKKFQYEYESFEIDIELEPNTIKIKKGEIVAKSGNSGGSSAPHLHYEIRDTKTEHALNPLLFGIKVKDTRKPVVEEVAIYGLGEKEYIMSTRHKYKCQLKGKVHKLAEDTLKFNAKNIGVSLKTYDRQDAASNKNGVYTIEMKVDSVLTYEFKMKSFSFFETRYLNAHVDYKERINNKSWYNKCFIEPANKLNNYPNIKGKGIIDLSDKQTHLIELKSTDVAGNISEVKFWVKQDNTGKSFGNPPNCTQMLYHDLPQEFTNDDNSIIIKFPENGFYNDVFFQYEKQPNKNKYGATHVVHEPNTAVHKAFKLSIKSENIPELLLPKAVIVQDTKKGVKALVTKEVVGQYIKSASREFGTFYIDVDSIAPTIKPLYDYNNKNLKKYGRLRFKIEDELSGINTYKGYIDNKWVLVEYDAKNNLLIHYFEKDLKAGKHEFELKVSDHVNNEKIYKFTFTR